MAERDSKLDAEKLAWNIESERQMDIYLRSLTWEQKVASIERMNEADKIAKQAMREAMGESPTEPERVSSEDAM